MAVSVPDTTTFSLQDVKDVTAFTLNKPNDLVAAIGRANEVAGGIPFLTRWDRRYVGSKNSLLNLRNWGVGGQQGTARIAGSHFTSFQWDTFVAAISGNIARRFVKVDRGFGTSWFSIQAGCIGTGTCTVTINCQTNNTGSAREGGWYMEVLQDLTTVRWQSIDTWFNQPPL